MMVITPGSTVHVALQIKPQRHTMQSIPSYHATFYRPMRAYTADTFKIVPRTPSNATPRSRKCLTTPDRQIAIENIQPVKPKLRLAREADVAIGTADTGFGGKGGHSIDAIGRPAAVGCSGSIVHLLLSELPH